MTIEAVRTSETSIYFYGANRHHGTEDYHLPLWITWYTAPCYDGNFSDTRVVRAVQVLFSRRTIKEIGKPRLTARKVYFTCSVGTWNAFLTVWTLYIVVTIQRNRPVRSLWIKFNMQFKIAQVQTLVYWNLDKVANNLKLKIMNKITQTFYGNRSRLTWKR
jgi:hypothetical protein